MTLLVRQWLADHQIQLWQPAQSDRAPLAHPSHWAGVAFRMVQDMELKSLTPFDISVFIEVLELPLAHAVLELTELARLTTELMRSLSRQRPLRRNEGTWLVFQIAYLRALQRLLNQEQHLGRAWLDRAALPVTAVLAPTLSDPQLQALTKTLRPGRLSDTQAEQAFSGVNSFLLQQMNAVAIAWLIANGAEPSEAQLLIQRLGHGLQGDLLLAIAENAAPLAQLQKFVGLGITVPWQFAALEDELYAPLEVSSLDGAAAPEPEPSSFLPSIDTQREAYRASLLQRLSEPWLAAPFALADLYVPLQGVAQQTWDNAAHSISSDRPPNSDPHSADLQTWMEQQLSDLETITVIEAGTGQGKTAFCQMWAAQIAQAHYPNWLPIVIPLRDVTLGQTLEQTLAAILPQARFTETDGWLAPGNPPCLLLLDGLEELPRSPQFEDPSAALLRQLIQFQAQQLQATGKPRHKLVLTCQTPRGDRASSGLNAGSWSPQFRHITLQPFEQEAWKQWFKRWSQLQSKPAAQAYFNTLKKSGLFRTQPPASDLVPLAQSPLLLYLMGLLHRDGQLEEVLFTLPYTQAKFEILDRGSRYLLKESRSRLAASDLPSLPQPLTLAHTEFGNYLAAQQLAHHLQRLTRQVSDDYGNRDFELRSPAEVAQHLYTILGEQILTLEVEQLAIEQLRRLHLRDPQNFSLSVLCERLTQFFQAYCRGQWLDAGLAHRVRSQLQRAQHPPTVLQIDAIVGLNVFVLLCATHREAQLLFWPCGDPQIAIAFHPNQLLTLIHRTAVLSPTTFWQRTRHSWASLQLVGANLQHTLLAGTHLQQANLSGADLQGANLSGANLQGANLAWANLSNANLQGANLTAAHLAGTNLQQTNLRGVQFQAANFAHACLWQAQLDDALQEWATENGARFNPDTTETHKQAFWLSHPTAAPTNPGAETDSATPTADSSGAIVIESAEGELMATQLGSTIDDGETLLMEPEALDQDA